MADPRELTEVDLSSPNRTDAAFFIGRLGSKELVEVLVPYITAPDGSIGIAAAQLIKLANESAGDEIIWVRNGQQAGGTTEIAADIKLTSLANSKVTVDHLKKEVQSDGEVKILTPTQFKVFEYLALNRGRVCSKEEILDAIRGTHEHFSSGVISVHIAGIRKSLGDGLSDLIRTRKGMGYIVDDLPENVKNLQSRTESEA